MPSGERAPVRSLPHRVGPGAAVAIAALILAAAACRGEAPAGSERGACRPDGRCDVGLVCASNRCVRPPPADCRDVAEQLASFELGNYAEPETRAPVVAQHQAACETTRVSRDEGDCVVKARDRWAAAQCVPRLFPELASSSTADCAEVAAKIRTATQKQMGTAQNARMMKWAEQVSAIMRESCEQDHWPDALKKCMLASDGAAFTPGCNQQTPPSLQQRIQERLQKAVQKLDRGG